MNTLDNLEQELKAMRRDVAEIKQRRAAQSEAEDGARTAAQMRETITAINNGERERWAKYKHPYAKK